MIKNIFYLFIYLISFTTFPQELKTKVLVKQLTSKKKGVGTIGSVKRRILELHILLSLIKPFNSYPLVVNYGKHYPQYEKILHEYEKILPDEFIIPFILK